MSVDSFNSFIQKWVTPATVVIVFGAIVWGVQLNILSLQHAKDIKLNAVAITDIRKQQQATAIQNAKMAALLKQTAEALSQLEKVVVEHNREAEQWKRQIIRNQDAIKRNQE